MVRAHSVGAEVLTATIVAIQTLIQIYSTNEKSAHDIKKIIYFYKNIQVIKRSAVAKKYITNFLFKRIVPTILV